MCSRIVQVLKGFSSERRIYESTLVGHMIVSIFWDLDMGSKLLRQDSGMTLPRGSVSDLPFSLKRSLGAGLSQDCALSVTDPSQKAISEPFVRQVQVPIFAVNKSDSASSAAVAGMARPTDLRKGRRKN